MKRSDMQASSTELGNKVDADEDEPDDAGGFFILSDVFKSILSRLGRTAADFKHMNEAAKANAAEDKNLDSDDSTQKMKRSDVQASSTELGNKVDADEDEPNDAGGFFVSSDVFKSILSRFGPKAADFKHVHGFNIWSGVSMFLLVLICCTCQFTCIYTCIGFMKAGFQQATFLEMCGFLKGPEANYLPMSQTDETEGPVKDDLERKMKLTYTEKLRCLVRREACFMMVLPMLPLIFLQNITCEDGVPNLVYYTYLPFLIRARLIEARILYLEGARWTSYVSMLVFSTL